MQHNFDVVLNYVDKYFSFIDGYHGDIVSPIRLAQAAMEIAERMMEESKRIYICSGEHVFEAKEGDLVLHDKIIMRQGKHFFMPEVENEF